MKKIKFESTFSIEDKDFEEICKLVIKKRKTVEKAVALVLDNEDYDYEIAFNNIVFAITSELISRGITDFKVR